VTATPAHIPGGQVDALIARVAALEKTVAALGNKTLFSANIGAGGLTVAAGGGIKLATGGTVTDTSGDVLVQSDPAGGIGRPWTSVPLYQCFLSSQDSTEPTQLQSNMVAGAPMWIGTVPAINWPRLAVYGHFGYIAGVGTTTSVTYVVSLISGVTTEAALGTFTVAGGIQYGLAHTFDVTPYLGMTTNWDVTIGIQSATGTGGTLMCAPSLWLVGTV
jgi:hypothetical protein